jgi:hypothetical protein
MLIQPIDYFLVLWFCLSLKSSLSKPTRLPICLAESMEDRMAINGFARFA